MLRFNRLSMLPLAVAVIILAAVVHAQPFGIESRSPNLFLTLTDFPTETPGAYQVQRVFPRFTFTTPVFLTEIPDGSQRLCVVQKEGLILAFPNSPNPDPGDRQTLLDLRDRVLNAGEQGLLGLAFAPDFAISGHFYVYYSWNGTNPGTSRVSRFTAGGIPVGTVDPATEEILLEVPQPFANHNSGMIAFGPDGMLYIGLGDGGSGGDPLNNGQDTTTLLGSILRIDVTGTPDPGITYRIPPDNPFFASGPAGEATRGEIYAYGLRNPWRFSFDQQTGDLYAGDVGQGAREEIDLIRAGGNYGWRIMEGTLCFNPAACDSTGLSLPLTDYGRTLGNSVTGGYVAYTTELPELFGMYIYGDFGSGRIWGLRYDGVAVTGPFTLVGASGLNISSFGQDTSGEIYVLDFSGGGVYILRPVAGGASGFPQRLSDIPALLAAGLGQDQTGQGILPYAPSARLWSDGLRKERYIALPGLDRIGYRPTGGWDFPEESLIVKNFILPADERDPAAAGRRIETRLLYRKNARWHGFSYEWDDAQSDATLLPTARVKQLTTVDRSGQTVAFDYLFPSRSQCLQCHTNAANGVLGLNTAQMNAEFTYPASGVTANQLETFDHIGLFTEPLPDLPERLPRMPAQDDPLAPLQERARAYLAANCAMCHQPGGTAPTSLDLRWEIANEAMNSLNTPPGNGDLGLADARIVDTADTARSVLLRRVQLRDGLFQMPPLATSRPDVDAISLLYRWIGCLEGPCPEVRINGANSRLRVSAATPLSVRLGLDPGNRSGLNSDLWIAAATPLGFFSLQLPEGWVPGLALGAQGPLGSLSPSVELFNGNLTVGDYTFYFVVDGQADGLLDLTWWDFVEVQVTP